MPRYFFGFRHRRGFDYDLEGMNLRDGAAAVAHAKRIARELVADNPDYRTWVVVVTDHTDHPVCEFPLSAAAGRRVSRLSRAADGERAEHLQMPFPIGIKASYDETDAAAGEDRAAIHLAEADERVADAERLVAQHEQTLARLADAGQDTQDAQRLLDILIDLLDAMRVQRGLLLARSCA
jgi:hypothetical protein